MSTHPVMAYARKMYLYGEPCSPPPVPPNAAEGQGWYDHMNEFLTDCVVVIWGIQLKDES